MFFKYVLTHFLIVLKLLNCALFLESNKKLQFSFIQEPHKKLRVLICRDSALLFYFLSYVCFFSLAAFSIFYFKAYTSNINIRYLMYN